MTARRVCYRCRHPLPAGDVAGCDCACHDYLGVRRQGFAIVHAVGRRDAALDRRPGRGGHLVDPVAVGVCFVTLRGPVELLEHPTVTCIHCRLILGLVPTRLVVPGECHTPPVLSYPLPLPLTDPKEVQCP